MKKKKWLYKWQASDNQKGFTLVELMVVLCLLVGLISAGYAVYIVGVKGYYNSISTMEAQNTTRDAMSIITSELRQADSYTITSSTTGVDSGTDTIIIETLKDTVEFYQIGGKLYCKRTNKADTSDVRVNEIATNMKSIKISQNSSIQCRVTLTSNEDRSGKSSELSSDVVIRQ